MSKHGFIICSLVVLLSLPSLSLAQDKGNSAVSRIAQAEQKNHDARDRDRDQARDREEERGRGQDRDHDHDEDRDDHDLNKVTVSLAAPADNTLVTAPGAVTLTADASVSQRNWAILRVEYYQGASLIGSATAAPYSVNWSNVPAGSYTLTAKAIATNRGQAKEENRDHRNSPTWEAVSAPVSLTVNAPPTVALTGPAMNQTYIAPASVTVTANATDSDGTVAKVEFYQGATLIGSATSAPYGVTWANAPAGSYTITAKATDNNGATASSDPVQIVVDAPPTVSLTSPTASQSYIAPASVTITADATDSDGSITKVEFYQGATLIGTATAAPYSVTWQNAPAGTYTLTAKATDDKGATTTSAPLQIVVNAPPTVVLSSPTAGQAYIAPASVTVTVDAADADGTVSKVEFYQGSTLIGTATAAPYTATWANAPAGTYTITAKATDNQGAISTSAALTITVIPNQLPSITLTTPTAGQRYTAPASINLTASAQDIDGQITRVEYYQGTTLIGTASAAPYAATWQNVPEGQYSLTAKAIDNGGGETYSSAVSLTVAPAGMRIYYLHSDHLNTPRVVTDEQNRIVWRNAPLGEPFGTAAPEEDPDGDGLPFTLNLRFPGQYFDRETNLSYNYFRDYNSETGRYIESDPVGLTGGINTYTYVGGDAISRVDPVGLEWSYNDPMNQIANRAAGLPENANLPPSPSLPPEIVCSMQCYNLYQLRCDMAYAMCKAEHADPEIGRPRGPSGTPERCLIEYQQCAKPYEECRSKCPCNQKGSK